MDAGWIITGSWPIDTEMESRVAAQDQARLGSSIHLVCRPREDVDGQVIENIGDWRDVLQELPRRIREWLPRLAAEGVVGADAIFACLGPALEIFSRYSRVEKASGDVISLRKYLEQVWAVVSQEALSTIFEGADASGFEPDARLTAIWFWVLKAASNEETSTDSEVDPTDDDNDGSASPSSKKTTGYAMEYDAVRKLAQGLGAELNNLSKPGGIISIKGSIASINTIRSREQHLFGGQLSFLEESGVSEKTFRQYNRSDPTVTLHSPKHRQTSLFDERPIPIPNPAQPFLPSFEPPADDRSMLSRVVDGGITMLDRLHQAMLLFGGGQSALLRIFFEKTGIGQDNRFWLLAQALSALYPAGSEEKRWVDGVLARKKGLGF